MTEAPPPQKPPEARPEFCQETAGFLFKHKCREKPFGFCAECTKATCRKHTHEFENDTLCTTCARKTIRKKGGKQRYRRLEDDPYFYGEYHYENYGRYDEGMWGHEYYDEYDDSSSYDDSTSDAGFDDADFSEADSESLSNEGDATWETDMTGS